MNRTLFHQRLHIAGCQRMLRAGQDSSRFPESKPADPVFTHKALGTVRDSGPALRAFADHLPHGLEELIRVLRAGGVLCQVTDKGADILHKGVRLFFALFNPLEPLLPFSRELCGHQLRWKH